MKKILFRYQAAKLKKGGKIEIVLGCVNALDLGKTKENFEKRGFQNFQYWIKGKEKNEKSKA